MNQPSINVRHEPEQKVYLGDLRVDGRIML